MILEAVRAVVGFLLVLFVPGYAATWALFPDDKEIDWIERIALSIGLSISLVVLTVYVMNLALGIKINFVNSLLIILLITLACGGIGYYRMRQKEEKGANKEKKTKCPNCGSEVITHYDQHYECDNCGRQWTQLKQAKKKTAKK